MIKVAVTPNGITMNGHAGHNKEGQDIVCAAISALTCNLVNSLNALTNDQIEADFGAGKTIIKWQQLSDKGKLLVDSWFTGIAAVNQEYNCITYE